MRRGGKTPPRAPDAVQTLITESGTWYYNEATGKYTKTDPRPVAVAPQPKAVEVAPPPQPVAVTQPVAVAQPQPVALEKERLEEAARASLENATVLEQVQGDRIEQRYGDQFQDWAANEFTLHDAQSRMYQADFDQKNFRRFYENGWTTGCNLILSQGQYDFNTHIYSLPLYLWYWRQSADDGPAHLADITRKYEGTTSYSVLASFRADESVARALRSAFDKGTLRLRVWFRVKSVLSHTKEGRTWHSVVFDIDTIKVAVE